MVKETNLKSVGLCLHRSCQYVRVVKGKGCQYVRVVKGKGCQYVRLVKGEGCQYVRLVKGERIIPYIRGVNMSEWLRGVGERMNRTLNEQAKSMRIRSRLSKTF